MSGPSVTAATAVWTMTTMPFDAMTLLETLLMVHLLLLFLLALFVYRWFTIHTWTVTRAMIVCAIADFVADVLDHPRVKRVCAETVRDGMNCAMDQPDLSDRIQRVSDSMQEINLNVSRSIGEQFPDLTKSFIEGAFSSMRSNKKRKNRDRNNRNFEQTGDVESFGQESDSSSFGFGITGAANHLKSN